MAEKYKKDKETSEQESFSGAYGFVIQPDQKTQVEAENLAKRLAPSAEFLVQNPHITLFYAKFENLPKDVVEKTLLELKANERVNLSLNTLQVYGERFIFWNIEDKDKLRNAHEKALETAKFLNQVEIANAIEEGLKLTQKEQDNIRRFGHPLVLNDYLPHITLAYDGNGIVLSSQKNSEPWEMKIDKIHFAEMGPYGSVRKIIL